MTLEKDLEKSYDARLQSPQTDGLHVDKPAETPLLKLMAIAMPRMAIRAAWGAQWAALGPYLQTLLPNFAVQLTQIIGPLTGIVVGPTIGVFSDRCTSKWGRRRPFLAFAAVGSIICWTLMGYTREIGDALGDVGTGKEGEVTDRTWTAVFTIVFYLWMDITVNIVQTPAYLLVSDFAGDRQTTGAALGQGWATLGSILVAVYIQAFGAAYKTMHWFLGMLSVLMGVAVLVACIVADEKPLQVNPDAPKTSAWKGVKSAFGSIWTGIVTLPAVLLIYGFIFFLNQYGYTAYNGSKGQFFGLEVYDGVSANAGTCGDDCTVEQENYNKGVKLAGGLADILFNVVGYIYSWILPQLVRRFGAKWVLTFATIPQAFLMLMAFSDIVALDVVIVIITSITLGTMMALLVPLVVHVFGLNQEIGMYVGALNSANCFGQLLNFAIGAALVETSLGYKLPVFIGGVMSLLGFFVSWLFFKIEMYSL